MVFSAEPFLPSLETFQMWVDGHKEDDVARKLMPADVDDGTVLALVRQDVADQFCMFESIMVRYLHDPAMIMTQLLCPMKPQERQALIEAYYGLNDQVLRELLGHQLTAKARKDLDVVASKSGVELRSCVRQFENLKRVVHFSEEGHTGTSGGPVCDEIRRKFCMPHALAWKYTCSLFLFKHRLHFHKHKKLFARIPTEAFLAMAGCMVFHWVASGRESSPSDVSLVMVCEAFRDLWRPLPAAMGSPGLKLNEVLCSGLKMAGKVLRAGDERKRLAAGVVRRLTAEGIEFVDAALAAGILKALRSICDAVASSNIRDIFEVLISKIVEPVVAAKPPATLPTRVAQTRRLFLGLVEEFAAFVAEAAGSSGPEEGHLAVHTFASVCHVSERCCSFVITGASPSPDWRG